MERQRWSWGAALPPDFLSGEGGDLKLLVVCYLLYLEVSTCITAGRWASAVKRLIIHTSCTSNPQKLFSWAVTTSTKPAFKYLQSRAIGIKTYLQEHMEMPKSSYHSAITFLHSLAF